MGWVQNEIMCMMHPEEKQHPGICSSCLREKLKQLPGLPFSMDPILPTSLSGYYSSSNDPSSQSFSPTSNHPGHRRISSNVTIGDKGSFVITTTTTTGRSRMGKSRSVTYVKRKRVKNSASNHVKKKEGFWSKLIRSTSIKTRCVFVQPKHAKE